MAEVAQDLEGVRIALRELLEEFFQSHVGGISEEAAANAVNADALRDSAFSRSLSPGYYDWAQHLLHLDRYRMGGIQLTFADVTEEEAQGLVMVAEERRRFQESHPACPSCRELNESSRFSCRGCGRSLMEKGAA